MLKYVILTILIFIPSSILANDNYDIREVAKLYCSSCHASMDGNTNVESYFEWLGSKDIASDDDLELFLRSVAESEFMPPSEWHRKQLREIIENDK